MSTDSNEIREVVRQKYGGSARTALAGSSAAAVAALSVEDRTRLGGRIMSAFIRAKKPEQSAP